MYDVHALVDVATLVFAVSSSYLACRRTMLDRIQGIEKDVAYLKGKIDYWDGKGSS